ncbi:MAG TPA: hypothetical protein VMT69_01585 [Kineosporiaceae bacterium]|nr:hypothetical protein [Kineosporiaceae bacterium]
MATVAADDEPAIVGFLHRALESGEYGVLSAMDDISSRVHCLREA